MAQLTELADLVDINMGRNLSAPGGGQDRRTEPGEHPSLSVIAGLLKAQVWYTDSSETSLLQVFTIMSRTPILCLAVLRKIATIC
jgi:hypothetical protein